MENVQLRDSLWLEVQQQQQQKYNQGTQRERRENISTYISETSSRKQCHFGSFEGT